MTGKANYVSELVSRFSSVFGSGGGGVRVIRAPGRVNLIGEHTDYNDGFVFPMAIEPEIRVAVRPRGDGVLRAASTFKAGEFVEFKVGEELTPHPEGKHWSNYLMGPVHFLKKAGVPVTGMDMLIDNTLPAGSGLSSSAALEVAGVRAQLLLTGQSMGYPQVAKICQDAEHHFPKAKVGIMDMTASAGGKAGHAMLLDCRSVTVQYVPLPVDDLRVVIMNTKVEHSLAGPVNEYTVRRNQCEEAARTLGLKALRDITPADFEKNKHRLSGVVLRRATHVVGEIQRCLDAAAALQAGDYELTGRLMVASHASLRDDYEVSCPELDLLSAEAMKVKGVYGARMTGGGFGGSAIALCQPRAVEPLKAHVTAAYEKAFGFKPDVIVTAATDGAGEVH